MDATHIQLLARWAGGSLPGGDALVSRVCTDSRKLEKGDLFVALRGENFDGHRFVDQAVKLGAAGAVVERGWGVQGGAEAPHSKTQSASTAVSFPLIRVEDTLAALQKMAAEYRRTLPLRVIGLTGSSGKTSTKDFTKAVLGERFRVMATEGNLNNHIGVPLTLLSASSADEIGIVEMGMNHPGEIAPLAAMAGPSVGMITNIGTAHLEFMGSREGIALEKGRLAEALPEDGWLIQNAKDDFARSIAARSKARAVFTGIGGGDVSAEVMETGLTGSRFVARCGDEVAEVFLPVPGVHMI